METLLQDIRYALRSLRQHPLFTVVAVVTLGLGIGANTAIFSVVDAVMLRPLRYDHPEQLVAIVGGRTSGGPEFQMSLPNMRDIRTQSGAFAQVAAFRYWLFNLSGTDNPQSLLGVYVGDSLFTALRVRPALGRLFGPGVESTAYPHEVVSVTACGSAGSGRTGASSAEPWSSTAGHRWWWVSCPGSSAFPTWCQPPCRCRPGCRTFTSPSACSSKMT
jgi:hypothetical protein